jgi:hypothetical protein
VHNSKYRHTITGVDEESSTVLFHEVIVIAI